MKMKTGLLALGLFTIAGAVTISCGGSSDSGDDTGSKAGTTSTSGNGTGGNSTAGNSTGGTTNNNGGTNTTAGTSNPTGGNTTGGTNNNAAGDNGGPGAAGDNGGPGAGGNGPMGCPATQPTDGATCMRGDGGFLGCTYGDQVCRCQRMGGGQNAMRSWQCGDAMGAGGAGPGGTVTCPANAMDNDACTGIGQCPGQQGCVCFNNNVNCF